MFLLDQVTDLVTVGVNHARAVIVPAPPGDADEADNYVLNIVMALKAIIGGQGAHIIAELRDVDNEDMVSLLGGTDVVTMVSHDIVGRMMTMAARQPGLAAVFETMLGFDGDEFYMEYWPEITGLKFGQLPELFPDAIVCGVCDGYNRVLLNPDPDYVLDEMDELIVIAEAFNSYQPYPFLLGFLGLEVERRHSVRKKSDDSTVVTEKAFSKMARRNSLRRNTYDHAVDRAADLAVTLRIIKATKRELDEGELRTAQHSRLCASVCILILCAPLRILILCAPLRILILCAFVCILILCAPVCILILCVIVDTCSDTPATTIPRLQSRQLDPLFQLPFML
jgi:hypothetical protein